MRVVLADDSVLLREGIARLLEDAGFEVVGQAGDPEQLMLKVRSYSPDVAIVDIRMPPDHRDEGLAAARAIKEHHPEVGVLVLSQYVEPHYALALVDDRPRGAGYLLKDRVDDLETLAASIRRIARGEVVIDPSVVAMLVNRARTHDPLDELTTREREVLRLMAEGRSNRAISAQLFLTELTVESHVRSIFMKLNLQPTSDDHRRVLAVLSYLRTN
jgi:DNA-binding NarL/FixJ family response regulator